jgi:sigma-B regulation protein RsbU (phosphoserine phosphatase)
LITNRKQKLHVILFLILSSFLAAHLCLLLLPNVFSVLNAQIVDKILLLRTNIKGFQQPYDDTIVHIDLNNTSIKELKNFYLNRAYHARVIRNLADMNVAAQVYDFIFAAPTSDSEDSALIEATSVAGNVYLGMAFELLKEKSPSSVDPFQTEEGKYLDKTKWQVKIQGDPAEFYFGANPLVTFLALASAAKGLGYLNMKPDPDGVTRRLPLLVRYQEGFYPSFSLRAVCDYLQVPPGNILVKPGAAITLKDARRPGEVKASDIVIPIDETGNMTVNFVGPWERIKHYNFVDIYRASDAPNVMEIWKEELSGKIALVSQVSTGSLDVGPVPTDNNFPLSGVHANVIHTILTESFVKELSNLEMLFIELPLMLLIFLLSVRFSSLPFSIGTLTLATGYAFLASLSLIYANVVFHFVHPLIMMIFALISILVANAIESAFLYGETKKAKELAERDLEIGRQIQAGFFPEKLPSIPGWEIVTQFKPARQVAGDFYDVFTLEEGKKVAIVMGDVCDKGVGAALFMALFRSLIRVFALESLPNPSSGQGSSHLDSTQVLTRTVVLTNNYIATTHGNENMFATMFFGILDAKSGLLTYINGGHEPPVVIGVHSIKATLKPTGSAVGMLPDLDFYTQDIQLEPNDILFTFTDGVTDAQSRTGEFFTKERLMEVLVEPAVSAEAFLNRILEQIQRHIGGVEQYDDLTMLALRRKERLS